MSLAFLLRRQAAKGAISTCLRAHCIKIDVSVMGSISPGQFPSSFSVTQSSLQSLSGCFQPNDPNWGGLFSRGFAAGSSGKETETVGEVAESAIKPVKAGAILQQMHVLHFRELLLLESENQISITYEDLLQKCQDSGAAINRDEAEEVCKALSTAGILLRYKNTVYLRPEEVADMVLRALPDTEVEVAERLSELESELEPLEKQKKTVDGYASRRSRVILWGGLMGLLTQFSLFLRLTFWELSWDVMEPIAYFVTLGTGIGMYIYFLATHQDFAYQNWLQRMVSNYKDEGYKKCRFDVEKYNKITQDIERYRRYMARFKRVL